jgi:hypothetical protein
MLECHEASMSSTGTLDRLPRTRAQILFGQKRWVLAHVRPVSDLFQDEHDCNKQEAAIMSVDAR